MPSASQTPVQSECRECCSFCDRLVYPAGCIEANCKYLYLYDDEQAGTRYMGCLNKVYKVEIDLDLFEQAERTRHGYGGVKMTGTPISECRSGVERAYHGHGEAFDCVNPSFFEPPSAETADHAFDLRDEL